MSLGSEQQTREHAGSSAALEPGRAEPNLAEETVPLRDPGERELESIREERVRLVVAGSRRRRGPGRPTAVLALAAVLACAGVLVALGGGSSAPHRTQTGASVPTVHPVGLATNRSHALEMRRREARRRRAEARARRRAARQHEVVTARRDKEKARARRERAAPRRRNIARAPSAAATQTETAAPEKAAATEEVVPVAEEPAVVATPEPAATEPSTSSSSTSSSTANETQKEFGFER